MKNGPIYLAERLAMMFVVKGGRCPLISFSSLDEFLNWKKVSGANDHWPFLMT